MDFIRQFFLNVSIAPLWLWFFFIISILALLVLDLVIFGRKHSGSKKKRAIVESFFWIFISLLFNLLMFYLYGSGIALEFFTGYLVEKSLSVDNLFVMLLIFSSLKIPNESQHRVLFYGILGAIIFRAIFILLGAKLIHSFSFVMYFFGAILFYTAVKILKHNEEKVDPENSFSIKLMKKFYPVTYKFNGNYFFILDNNTKKATPLFVALIIIEASDIVFAVDSIPAVFAITQDAFVAFSSNILAILGLRALYFVLADFVSKLTYLKPGLAIILGFIGIKMMIMDFVHIPSLASLAVIIVVLIVVSLLSWINNRKEYKMCD